MRYIEPNPVRAEGMASHPSEYPWSSYRCNALGTQDRPVMPHREYQRLGATAGQRQSAYRQLFRARIPKMTLAAKRGTTSKAWVLGSDHFKIKMEKKLNRPVVSNGHGGDQKSEVARKMPIIIEFDPLVYF